MANVIRSESIGKSASPVEHDRRRPEVLEKSLPSRFTKRNRWALKYGTLSNDGGKTIKAQARD
jgi:hypothetical protein